MKFQFVYTHITSFVTHTHSEVVAMEVMAEDLRFIHVHPDPFVLENSAIAQNFSRIAPNYQTLLGPFCTRQINYVNLYVFILTNIILYLFHFVFWGSSCHF